MGSPKRPLMPRDSSMTSESPITVSSLKEQESVTIKEMVQCHLKRHSTVLSQNGQESVKLKEDYTVSS